MDEDWQAKYEELREHNAKMARVVLDASYRGWTVSQLLSWLGETDYPYNVWKESLDGDQ